MIYRYLDIFDTSIRIKLSLNAKHNITSRLRKCSLTIKSVTPYFLMFVNWFYSTMTGTKVSKIDDSKQIHAPDIGGQEC